jgi:hypothetical protein
MACFCDQRLSGAITWQEKAMVCPGYEIEIKAKEKSLKLVAVMFETLAIALRNIPLRIVRIA